MADQFPGLGRRGGIVISNALAVLKVLILGAIIIIGFAASAGASFGHRPVHGETVDPDTGAKTSNFSTKSSFSSASDEVSSYASALLFIAFTFSGYEQPFYVSDVFSALQDQGQSILIKKGSERSLPAEEEFRQIHFGRLGVPLYPLHACQHCLCW